MEDTLRVKEEIEKGKITSRLNPCFNGRYSQRLQRKVKVQAFNVLILVLMEDTLREFLRTLPQRLQLS